MLTFSIRVAGVTVSDVRPGENLGEVCDRHSAPLDFMCRGASCGTCAVRVVEGSENLSAMKEDEATFLEAMFGAPPDVRLGCQLDLKGPVTLEAYSNEES
jgi:ferredoxin